jgi:hypothetical protein
MGRFDEDTSIMRMRLAATLIDLQKPEYDPQTKVRGIATGAVLGVIAWAAILMLGAAIWRWLTE